MMKNRIVLPAVFAVGLMTLGWIGWTDAAQSPLSSMMVVLMAAFYAVGAAELRRHERDTEALALLARAPQPESVSTETFKAWLDPLPEGLRLALARRIETGHGALPGPSLTPYLVGLLVLLGMLGTFIGMVATLKGTVTALDSTTDLPAMRAALAAPVRGLGLAFGASVAGVAASACLGLMSALTRRHRAQVLTELDRCAASHWATLGPAQRQALHTRALERQVDLLPQVVDRLDQLMSRLDAQTQRTAQVLMEQQQALNQSLAAQQQTWATASIEQHAALNRTLLEQQEALHGRLAQGHEALHLNLAERQEAWQRTLAHQHEAISQLMASRHEALSTSLQDRQLQLEQALQAQALRAQQQQADHARTVLQQAVRASTDGLGAAVAQALQATTEATRQALQQVGHDVGHLVQALETQLAATSDRAATGLGQTVTDALAAFDEQTRRVLDAVAESTAGLTGQVQHQLLPLLQAVGAQHDQQQALLARLSATVETSVQAASQELQAAAANTATGTVELARLGEALASAVQAQAGTSQSLGEQLQGITAALTESVARSDEQMGYYVAQAREIVEMSLAAQKQVLDELQALRQATDGGVRA